MLPSLYVVAILFSIDKSFYNDLFKPISVYLVVAYTSMLIGIYGLYLLKSSNAYSYREHAYAGIAYMHVLANNCNIKRKEYCLHAPSKVSKLC